MKKLIILALLLGVTGSAWASNDWLTSAASSSWFDPANWDDGVVPSLTDTTNTRTFQTHMNTNFMPIINSGENAEVGQLEIGGDSQALIPGNFATITLKAGGTLSTADYFRHGASSSSIRWGKFIMEGGTCNVGDYMATGYGGSGAEVKGWTIVSGGTINVAGDWRFANGPTASGYAYLSGDATVNVAGILNMRPAGGTGDTLLDITGNAKVVLAGDQFEQVLAYRDNGWIQSAGVDLEDEYITFDGTNTILQIPEPATLCILAIGALGLIRRK